MLKIVCEIRDKDSGIFACSPALSIVHLCDGIDWSWQELHLLKCHNRCKKQTATFSCSRCMNFVVSRHIPSQSQTIHLLCWFDWLGVCLPTTKCLHLEPWSGVEVRSIVLLWCIHSGYVFVLCVASVVMDGGAASMHLLVIRLALLLSIRVGG